MKTILFAIAFCLVCPGAGAQVPLLVSHQGILLESGAPAADGDYVITFSLYDAATGGNLLWVNTRTVSVSNGVFSVVLGELDITLDESVFSQPLWLGIQLDANPEFSPRTRFTTSPYAFLAATVKADAITGQHIVDGSITGADINSSTSLSVSSLTASSITISATRYKTFMPAALQPMDSENEHYISIDADTWWLIPAAYNSAREQPFNFILPLDLPNGSQLQQIDAFVLDNNETTQITLTLYESATDFDGISLGGVTNKGNVLSGNGAASQVLSLNVEVPIQNDQNAYWVAMNIDGSLGNIKLGPIRVTYTIDTPLP